jgi:hypothetical protein
MLLSNEALFSSLSNLASGSNNLAAAAAAVNGWPANLLPFEPEALNEFILQHFASQVTTPNRTNNNNLPVNTSASLNSPLLSSNSHSPNSNMSSSGRSNKNSNNLINKSSNNKNSNSNNGATSATSDMLTNFLRQSGVEDLKSNLDVFIQHIESQKASQAELNAQFKSIQKALNSINAVNKNFIFFYHFCDLLVKALQFRTSEHLMLKIGTYP